MTLQFKMMLMFCPFPLTLPIDSSSLTLIATCFIGLRLSLVVDDQSEGDLFRDDMKYLFGYGIEYYGVDDCLIFWHWPPQNPL